MILGTDAHMQYNEAASILNEENLRTPIIIIHAVIDGSITPIAENAYVPIVFEIALLY